MRIIIESEDETSTVEIREAGAHVGEADTGEAGGSGVWSGQAVPESQTFDAGAAPAEFRGEPTASENGDSELIDIGGFQAR